MRFWQLGLAAALMSAFSTPLRAEVPDKELPVIAKVPRNGDFLGYGFGSVWMMSGAKLARIRSRRQQCDRHSCQGQHGQAARLPDRERRGVVA